MYESMAPGGLPIAPAPAAPAAARTPEAKHSGSFESSGTTANQSNNRGGSVSNNARNSSSSNINSNSNSKGSIISSSSKRNKSDTAIPTLKSATLLPSPGSRNEAVKLEDVKESSSSTTATGTSAGQQKKRKWTVEERSQHSVVEKRRREDLNLKLLTLARNLPTLADKKRLSKGIIAQGAIEHILHERQLILDSIPEIKALLAQNTELVQEVNTWRRRNGISDTVKPVNETVQTQEKEPPQQSTAANKGTGKKKESEGEDGSSKGTGPTSKADDSKNNTDNNTKRNNKDARDNRDSSMAPLLTPGVTVYNRAIRKMIEDVENYTYNAFPGGFTGQDELGGVPEEKEPSSASTPTTATTTAAPSPTKNSKQPSVPMNGQSAANATAPSASSTSGGDGVTPIAASIPLPPTPSSITSNLPTSFGTGGSAIHKSVSMPLPLAHSLLASHLPSLGTIASSSSSGTSPSAAYASGSSSTNLGNPSSSGRSPNATTRFSPGSLNLDTFDLAKYFDNPQNAQALANLTGRSQLESPMSAHSTVPHQQQQQLQMNHQQHHHNQHFSHHGGRPHSNSFSHLTHQQMQQLQQQQQQEHQFSPMHTNLDLPFNNPSSSAPSNPAAFPPGFQTHSLSGHFTRHSQPTQSLYNAFPLGLHGQDSGSQAGLASSNNNNSNANVGQQQQQIGSMTMPTAMNFYAQLNGIPMITGANPETNSMIHHHNANSGNPNNNNNVGGIMGNSGTPDDPSSSTVSSGPNTVGPTDSSDGFAQFPMSSSNLDFLSQWPRDFDVTMGGTNNGSGSV